jgi:hypothetical protein
MGRMDGIGWPVHGDETEVAMDATQSLQGRIAQLQVEREGLLREIDRVKRIADAHETEAFNLKRELDECSRHFHKLHIRGSVASVPVDLTVEL